MGEAEKERPFVSIVIPVKDGASRLPSCLESLRELDWPLDRLEVIIADGRSRDDTRGVAERFGAVVVDNPKELVASGRNVGFLAARGEVVAFTDDDCTFERAWLRNAVAALLEKDVAGVGGPTLVPSDETPFGLAVALFFRLGVRLAGSVHRERLKEGRDVTDLPGCNMLYKKEALARVMPGPETLLTAEDVELGYRLRDLGYRLRSAPDVRVYHHKRPTARRFFRQMARFARGRVQLSRRRPGVLRAAHVLAGLALPICAALFLGLLALSPPLLWSFPGAAALVWLLALAATRSPGVAARAVPALFGGLSAWSYGFLREWLFPAPTEPERFDGSSH